MPVKETLQGPLNGFSPEQNSGFPILLFFLSSSPFFFLPFYFFCHFPSPGIIKNWRHRFITAASVLLSHQEFSNAQSWLTNADLQSFGLPTELSSWGAVLLFFLFSAFLFDSFFFNSFGFYPVVFQGKYGFVLTVFLKHRLRFIELCGQNLFFERITPTLFLIVCAQFSRGVVVLYFGNHQWYQVNSI